jgi:hypothetical protein
VKGGSVRSFMALLALLLLASITALQLSPINAQTTHTKHGCASPVPPPVPGSPRPAPATPGEILLNEVLLEPQSVWNCSDTGTSSLANDSWVELFNPQNQPLDLYTVHASLDSGPNTNAYYLPYGAAIPAHGFLVLFPHTGLTFARTETNNLRLVIPDTTSNQKVVIDQVTVPQLAGDQSYARIYDGAPSWQVTSTPTIDASNTPAGMTPLPTSGTASRGGSSNKATVVSGFQPPWNKLHLPTPAPTSPVTVPARTSASTPSAPSTSPGLDITRRILLTILIAALALTLFWCWRLFRRA